MDAETGDWTARGQQIVDHTPMNRFGQKSVIEKFLMNGSKCSVTVCL
jgi:hypothetical protein